MSCVNPIMSAFNPAAEWEAFNSFAGRSWKKRHASHSWPSADHSRSRPGHWVPPSWSWRPAHPPGRMASAFRRSSTMPTSSPTPQACSTPTVLDQWRRSGGLSCPGPGRYGSRAAGRGHLHPKSSGPFAAPPDRTDRRCRGGLVPVPNNTAATFTEFPSFPPHRSDRLQHGRLPWSVQSCCG